MTATSNKNRLVLFILAISLIAGSGIGYSKLYLYHIIGVYTLLLLFVTSYSLNPDLKFNKIYLYFVVFVIYNIAGLIWTLNRKFTFYQIFYLLVGFSIIILVNYLLEKKKQNYLIITIVFGLVIGLFEISGVARWPLSPYSKYIIFFGRVFKGAALGDHIRIPTVFFGNPNDLSLALNYLLCFILFLDKKLLKIFLAIPVVFIVMQTGSRGGQLTTAFIVFCYFLFFSKLFRTVGTLFLPFIGYGLYVIIQKLIIRLNIDSLMNFSYAGTHNSIGIRQQLYLNCFNFLKENGGNLILGAGGGASKQVQISAENTFGILSTHFFALELLTEYGIIIFCILIIAYFISLHRLYKISRQKSTDNNYIGAVFLALLATLPGSISTSSIIYFFPFWIILGFTVFYLKNYRRLCATFTSC